MCGAYSSTIHVRLFPPNRVGPPAGSPENRNPIRGRIWQNAQGDRSHDPRLLECVQSERQED
jgi:hypothetical protein